MADHDASMVDYIGEYLTYLRTDLGRADATVQTYAVILRRLDRQLPYGLARAHSEELKASIWNDKREPATLAVYRAAVASFFRWVTNPDVDLLDFDPSRLLPRVKVPTNEPDPVDDDEVADILTRASEPYLTWFLLARYAGLRCVEISRLDREHLTPQRLRVVGKGDKSRTIPTHADVWDAVAGLPRGPVARSSRGERATRKQVKDRGNRHLQKTLGYPDVHMHRFRHNFITDVYREQGEFVAQKLAGHASPATTAIYAAVSSAAMAAAVAALPRVGAR